MLAFYNILTALSGPLLSLLLIYRISKGKEDKFRLHERKGQPLAPRPKGQLIWIHAASVGEAQSALILIKEVSATDEHANFLVTSGTKTSAELMSKRLPQNAIHQYYPLDHPKWTQNFINHWQPDLVLWMESELWPNMLLHIQKQNIPAALINARMSDRSFKRWHYFKQSAVKLIKCFNVILAQTATDQERFLKLGAKNVHITDNLKHSAVPLPLAANDLKLLQNAISDRPLWLYASTHEGEETLAARIHEDLKETYPNLLTIIVPRHPERRKSIQADLKTMGTAPLLRGEDKVLPNKDTGIYIVDTLGELGLFYSLSSLAVIGRSFSHDGGGGHNPIEAAQLNCAVLTGPNVQNQTELFNQMFDVQAAQQVNDEKELLKALKSLLGDNDKLNQAISRATEFSQSKTEIIDNVMNYILPLLPETQKEAA